VRIGSLGLPELLVIAGLIVLLFSAGSLPRLGRRLGEFLRRPFRQAKWLWTSFAGSEADAVRAEEEYGRECAREVAGQFPGKVAAPMQQSVSEIGSRLAGTVGGPRKFSFCAVAARGENAFALPGGFIFVSESLLDLCEADQDEVAFILGHEMGHVLRSHARERLMADAILKAVTARSPGAGHMLRRVVAEGYSREQELEADREAIRVAAAAGFDARGAVRALRRLDAVSPKSTGLAEYFSSHPPVSERVRALEEYFRR
jgi:predicted Zn-dependent protease